MVPINGSKKTHSNEWMLFPENLGWNLSVGETSLSNGELYTIVTNKAAQGRKGALATMVTLNFFDNRSTNASTESFNAKLKSFRSSPRGM